MFGSRERHARSSRVGRSADRADAVLPPVAGDEVAARVAHQGGAELPHELDDVAAEARLVGGRVVRLVDPGVDATPHVLDEGAEQPPVDRRQGEARVEHQRGVGHVARAVPVVERLPGAVCRRVYIVVPVPL